MKDRAALQAWMREGCPIGPKAPESGHTMGHEDPAENCGTFKVRAYLSGKLVQVKCYGCGMGWREVSTLSKPDGEIDPGAIAMVVCSWMTKHAHERTSLTEVQAERLFRGLDKRDRVQRWVESMAGAVGESVWPVGWDKALWGDGVSYGYRLEPDRG